MEIHDKIKPTHHFETIEISTNIGAKLHLSIAIPPSEKRRRVEEHLINNMVRKCIRRLEKEYQNFIDRGYKLEE